MAELIKKPELDLIEPVGTPTIHADGVARATLLGDDVHIVFYEDQVGLGNEVEHHVAGRLVIRVDLLRNNSMLISEAVLGALADRARKVM